MKRLFIASTIALGCALGSFAADPPITRPAAVRAVDLNLHETQELSLADQTRVSVKLLSAGRNA